MRSGLMVVRKVALALGFFLLFIAMIVSPEISIIGGEANSGVYSGMGKECPVLEYVDFTQTQAHGEEYENFWNPSSFFPSNYTVEGPASILASNLTTRTDPAFADTFSDGSGWTLGSHCSIGTQGYLRFYSTDASSYSEYAHKMWKVGGYNPTTVSSVVLYWDCYRALAGGIQTVDLSSTSCVALKGSVTGGDHTSTHASDDNYLLVQSGFVEGDNNYAIRVGFQFNVGAIDRAALQQMEITIELHWTTDPNGALLRVAKVSGDLSDVLSNISGTSDTKYVALITNPLDYIDAAGNVIVRLNSYSCVSFACYIDYLCVRLHGRGPACGDRESLIWTDGEGTVTNTFHADNTSGESGWHKCSWDLTSRKSAILGYTCQVKFEFAQTAYSISDFRVDNLSLEITFDRAYAVYDKPYDLTGGALVTIPYIGGAITLCGCDFTAKFSTTLKNPITISIHTFQLTNGSKVVQTLEVPTRSPTGGSFYFTYRTFCIIPKDYSLLTVTAPNNSNVTTLCPPSTWDGGRKSIYISNSVIDTYGFGTYKVTCLSPNYVTKAESWLGDKSFESNHFMRGETIQLKTNLTAYGNYHLQASDPTDTTIFDRASNGSGTIWHNISLSTSAILGQYTYKITFDNGLEEGFLQKTFCVEANEASLQWSGDVAEIVLSGAIRNTRTQGASAQNTKFYALLMDTQSPNTSPGESIYPYPMNGRPFIKKTTINPRVAETYNRQVIIDIVVSAPLNVSGTWQIRTQISLANNPSGSITYYYDHNLSTSDTFTYEFRVNLADGSCNFVNSSLTHYGPSVSNGTAWKALYNKRIPTYFEVLLTLLERTPTQNIIDEKPQQLFITPKSGRILSIHEGQTDAYGQFLIRIPNPAILTPPSNTTLELFCMDAAGISLKTLPIAQIWSRTLYVDANSLDISGCQDEARIRVRLLYDKNLGQPYRYVGAGIKCGLIVDGTSYTTQTDANGWACWMNTAFPENTSTIIVHTADIDDQTHSNPISSPQWITCESPACNFTLAAEKTTVSDVKLTLNDLLVNPNQTVTATFTAKSNSNYVKLHLLCRLTCAEDSWTKELWINPSAKNTTSIEFAAPSTIGANYPVSGSISCHTHPDSTYRRNTLSLNVTAIVIDQLTITPSDFINVGDTVLVNVHAIWAHNNSKIVNGSVTGEGLGTALTNSQGWTVFSVKKNIEGVYIFKAYGTEAPSDITYKGNTLTKTVTWTALKIRQPPVIIYNQEKPEFCVIQANVIWAHNNSAASGVKVFISELPALSAFTDSQGWTSVTVKDTDWNTPWGLFTFNSTASVSGHSIKCVKTESVTAKLLYLKLISLTGYCDNATLKFQLYREDALPQANVNIVLMILCENYNRTATITSDSDGYITIYGLNLPHNTPQISFIVKQATYLSNDMIINESPIRSKLVTSESTVLHVIKAEPNDFLVNPEQLCYGQFIFQSNATHIKLDLSLAIFVETGEVVKRTLTVNPSATTGELLPYTAPKSLGAHKVTFRITGSLSSEITYTITVTKIVLHVDSNKTLYNLGENATLTIRAHYAHNSNTVTNTLIDLNGTRGYTNSNGCVEVSLHQPTVGVYKFVATVLEAPDNITAHTPVSWTITWTGILVHGLGINSDNPMRSVVTVSAIWAHNNTPIKNALVEATQIMLTNTTDGEGLARFAISDSIDYFGDITFEALKAPENITACLERATVERHQLRFSTVSARQSEAGITIVIRFYYENERPAEAIEMKVKLNRVNESITATTDENGIIEIQCPQIYAGPITIQAQSITELKGSRIIDRRRLISENLFSDDIIFNELLTLPTETFTTGQDIVARVYIQSTCGLVTATDLWLRASLAAENGSIITIISLPNWPRQLNPGERVETYLNLTKLQRSLSSGEYTLTVALLCGENATIASCGKEVYVKQVFDLTVTVQGDDGSPVLGAEVWLKKVLPQNRTMALDKTVTDLSGTACFDVEVGAYTMEVYLNGQRISSKTVEIDEPETCPFVVASQKIQSQPQVTGGDNPQLVFAAVIAVLCSLLILAVRRRRIKP